MAESGHTPYLGAGTQVLVGGKDENRSMTNTPHDTNPCRMCSRSALRPRPRTHASPAPGPPADDLTAVRAEQPA
ncbi:hypothetical protein GCM10023405_48170 [Streptomonospora salina]